MASAKAEKRVASSVFITLVPPRREAAAKARTPREPQLEGAEAPGPRRPQPPPLQPPVLPNGGEGRPRGAASRAARMTMAQGCCEGASLAEAQAGGEG